jgi:2-polyprenyl-3-methyl-5-hydroxy-6-metoxy-1,4-benzoquinol methylase
MDAQASASAIYEEFRAWRNEQPPKIRQSADLLDHYRASLKARRLSDAEIEERIRLISEDGQRLETERWNRILTSDAPTFNTQPNAFLVEMIRNLPVGRALDVGMGQGRNAIFLAQQGWQVTGFDPAEKAVALARQQAAAAGIKIEAHVQRSQGFDWGENR